jgi:hypothetical protein
VLHPLAEPISPVIACRAWIKCHRVQCIAHKGTLLALSPLSIITPLTSTTQTYSPLRIHYQSSHDSPLRLQYTHPHRRHQIPLATSNNPTTKATTPAPEAKTTSTRLSVRESFGPCEDSEELTKNTDMGAKKFGGAQGQKIAGNRGMSEKIVRSFIYPSFTFPLFLHY